MLKDEELYEGLTKEKRTAYRNVAIENYGDDAVNRSESHLKKKSKEELVQLKKESETIYADLVQLQNDDPRSKKVQSVIARHYENIREFWGTTNQADKQGEAYKGLGELYVSDERFIISMTGQTNPQFAEFIRAAMAYFVDQQLK